MSIELMTMVWASDVPAPRRFTLLAVADSANDEGVCWPSIGALADKCLSGESTVRRHLQQLAKEGLLVVNHRFNSSSIYTVNVPALAARRRAVKPRKTPVNVAPPVNLTPPPDLSAPGVNLSGPPSQSEHLTPIEPSKNPQGGARARADSPAPATPGGPPPRRCPRHEGTSTPGRCGDCKDARMALEAWERERPATVTVLADRYKPLETSTAFCDDCRAEAGYLVDPETKQPLGKCKHPRIVNG